MHKHQQRYRESLLQWIWEHLEFNVKSIQTCCKKQIKIEHPGEWNPGAGPDFLNARIQIDDLIWHGHIEIHREEEDWYKHSHHTQPDFDGVILHVFFQRGSRSAIRSDGSTPYGLYLTPFLEKPLYNLLETKNQSDLLPCSGINQYISDDVFHQQVIKSKQEYFEYKKEELIRFEPLDPIPSESWKISFITGIYSALGIPRNRRPMVELAQSIYRTPSLPEDKDKFIRFIVDIADIENREKWNHTGMRPSGRPDRRIYQAAHLHYKIHHTPIVDFLKLDTDLWPRLIDAQEKTYLPGRRMREILYATVFLPALYLLGDQFYCESVKEKSHESWFNFETDLPKTILRPFEKSGLPAENHQRNPGLIHQLKRYCRSGNCHRCKVFEMAIRS